MSKRNCTLVLHNIRSVHNVGSIFRTADGAGGTCIILSGYTPGPLDPKGKPRKDFAKVALGAEESVEWSRSDVELEEVIDQLKEEGREILALECDGAARDLFSYTPKQKFALVLGSEVDGVPPSIMNKADAIISIPMRGIKSSLNVSVATGIALYSLVGNGIN